jgi:hypothetical protein
VDRSFTDDDSDDDDQQKKQSQPYLVSHGSSFSSRIRGFRCRRLSGGCFRFGQS